MPEVICMMTTFNRVDGDELTLVNEAVNSFLKQTCKDASLFILNDTPGQELWIDHDSWGTHGRIVIHNFEERFPTLGDKIQWCIDKTWSKYLCRWDDDDISLPDRLNHSLNTIGNYWYYQPTTYWFAQRGQPLHYQQRPCE